MLRPGAVSGIALCHVSRRACLPPSTLPGMHVADAPPFIQDSGWAEVIRYSSQRCGRGLSCYADCAPGYDEGFGHGYTTDNGDTYKASQNAARSVLLSYLPLAPPRHYFLLITRHLRSIPPCHQCPHHRLTLPQVIPSGGCGQEQLLGIRLLVHVERANRHLRLGRA